jgi:hypothetical protein
MRSERTMLERRVTRCTDTVSRSPSIRSLSFILSILCILTRCPLATFSTCRWATFDLAGEAWAAEPAEAVPSFRRLLLSAEQLPEEMKRVRDGVLVRLPRAEFEALVEKATQAAAGKSQPRLLDARYHAKLKDDALIGEGQWKLMHKGPGLGLLKLDPFNLALRQARFENSDAIVASFDGKNPAVLVEGQGERTVSLEWSARGESGPDGLQFHLEMPASPVAVLELDVPVGRGVVMLKDGALLSGPHEAEKADLRRWRIVCGGRPSIDVLILPLDRSEDSPTPFLRQRTTHKLDPQGLDTTFELTLEASTRSVRELVCECDSELRLREVIGPNVGDCIFQNGDERKPSRLTIRLREAMRAGTWQIQCMSPLNRSSSPTSTPIISWRSPGLRALNGVSRGETIALWLHPELRVENWDFGSFRLASSEIERSSGGQLVTLQGGGLGPLRRPSGHFRIRPVEFRVQQSTWWRWGASGLSLTAQVAWDFSQGQLFQLPVRLPPQWKVEKVELNPAWLLRDWRIRGPSDNATLLVALTEPIGARMTSDGERVAEPARSPTAPRARPPVLTVYLKNDLSSTLLGKRLPFPDVVPQGARIREGALALDCDEQLFHLDVETIAERSETDIEGPWGQQVPEYCYRFKGQPPTGHMRVLPRSPRLRAKCETELLLASGRADIEMRLLLEVESGSPKEVDLFLSNGDRAPWLWHNENAPRGEESSHNRVIRTERLYGDEVSSALHLFAARSPLPAAAVVAAWPRGEHWRLTLASPLRARQPLRLHARRSLQPRDNHWEIPLPIVRGAERMEGEVRLHLERSDLVHLHTFGLREAAAVPGSGKVPWRTFRYGDNAVELELSGAAPTLGRTSSAVVDRARLLTYAGREGVLRHHFAFRLTKWNERMLPLLLPPDSRPTAVQIDGRWLPRLLPKVEGNNNSPSADPIELDLPVPNRDESLGDNVHYFEVVYTRPAQEGMWWQRLDAPAPSLPVVPLSFHRIWRLAPHLTPLHPELYQSMPGTDEPRSGTWLPHRFADFFHLPAPWRPFDPLEADRSGAAREALERAGQELRGRRADRTTTLREMVRELAFDYLKDRYILLLDAVALSEAGIGPETTAYVKPLSAADASPPWSAWGLIAVPSDSVILLTTSSGRGAAFRDRLSEEMETTLTETAARGQDPSGRFLTALNWLHGNGTSGVEPPSLDFETDRTDWIEWEPIAGVQEDSPLVLRRDGVTAAGLILVFAVGLFFWLQRRWLARLRLTSILLLLAVLGLCVLWLPGPLRDASWWALLAACAGAAGEYLLLVAVSCSHAGSKTTLRRPRNASPAAVIGVMLSLTLLCWPGRADAPTAYIVYLLPTKDETPDKQMVLVPVALLERLKGLAKPNTAGVGGPSAVLLDAVYEGQVVEGQAEFAAVFSAYSLTDETTSLALPLSEVQLTGEVLLDGARVSPSALPAPQTGYLLRVRGRGRHKIELHFRVPIVGTAEDRNVQFTAPPLPRSRLSWRAPVGAVEPQALVKHGAQWMVRDPSGERLEADLGAVPRPVHLHWSNSTSSPVVTYRAAYLWDLGVESSRLTAWLRYRVRRGAVKTIEFDLPDELVVSAVSAQRITSNEPMSWLSRVTLRDWRVGRAEGKRRLYLDFPYPIQGDFQATLRLLPRGPLSARSSLPLPTPLGARASGSCDLAYRTDAGLSAHRYSSNYLTRMPVEQFAADWPDVPHLEENFSGEAYLITPDHTPQLALNLSQSPPAIEADIEVAVQAGAHSADFRALADLKSAAKDMAYLEWELPAADCTIVSAIGEDVRAWKQDRSRLIVWLNRTTAATRLQFVGWIPYKASGAKAHLEWTGPGLRSALRQHTRLRLVTGGDQVLSELAVRNLRPLASSGTARRTSEQEAAFESTDSSYQLRYRVLPAPNAVARVLTLAEADQRQLRFTSTVVYRVTHGELRRVQVRLRNWERENVEVRAEGVVQPPSPRRTGGELSWQIQAPPGIVGEYRVMLRGSMPLDEAVLGMRMPEILAQGVERTESFLAVTGEISAQAIGALKVLPLPRKDLSSWPAEAERVERSAGQAWRVTDSEWHMRLLPRTQGEIAAPSRVFLTDHAATVVDGRRWLHEACWWLRHEAHADLNLDFPAPARILATSVDGVDVTSLQTNDTRIWLPLPGRPGVRCLRIRWMYDSPQQLDRPNLTPPRVADAIQGPTLCSVRIPSGWEASRGEVATSLGSGAPREAALSLYRAAAQLQIVQTVVDQERANSAEALAASRRRFAFFCREAEDALAQGGRDAILKGPNDQSLSEWMAELQAAGRDFADKEKVKRVGEETINEGEKALDTYAVSPLSSVSSSSCLPGFATQAGGIVVSWYTRAGSEPPRLQLISRVNQEKRRALTASSEWIGGLVVVWILSLLPFVLVKLRMFWPEQIALFGFLGWYLAGGTSVVLGLFLLAACCRLLLLIRGIRGSWQGRRRQPSTMSAPSGGG